MIKKYAEYVDSMNESKKSDKTLGDILSWYYQPNAKRRFKDFAEYAKYDIDTTDVLAFLKMTDSAIKNWNKKVKYEQKDDKITIFFPDGKKFELENCEDINEGEAASGANVPGMSDVCPPEGEEEGSGDIYANRENKSYKKKKTLEELEAEAQNKKVKDLV